MSKSFDPDLGREDIVETFEDDFILPILHSHCDFNFLEGGSNG